MHGVQLLGRQIISTVKLIGTAMEALPTVFMAAHTDVNLVGMLCALKHYTD